MVLSDLLEASKLSVNRFSLCHLTPYFFDFDCYLMFSLRLWWYRLFYNNWAAKIRVLLQLISVRLPFDYIRLLFDCYSIAFDLWKYILVNFHIYPIFLAWSLRYFSLHNFCFHLIRYIMFWNRVYGARPV